MPHELRLGQTGIPRGTPSLQHLHLCLVNYRLQNVCIRQQANNHVCWWRLTNSGKGAKERHGNRRWIPPDLEVKTQWPSTKAVLAVFHLNKEAKHELKVNHSNETLLFWSEPKYLGEAFDRSLTYRRHLESLRKKLTSRTALLRWLLGVKKRDWIYECLTNPVSLMTW